MARNKYSDFLTILLIILLAIILIGGGIFIYLKLIKPYFDGEEIEAAISNFDINKEIKEENNVTDESIETTETSNEIDLNEINSIYGRGTGTSKKSYYKGYVMLGYIEIPKTGIKYPIIEETTVAALETSVAALYPSNAILNAPGNVVIVGHNYRNGKFFSNNKNLSAGDKIYITSNDGKVEYIIYEVFETTPTDTSFYGRDTAGIPEITLSTCTDNGEARLIILAKANV